MRVLRCRPALPGHPRMEKRSSAHSFAAPPAEIRYLRRRSMPRGARSAAHTRIAWNPPRRRHRQIRSREGERRPPSYRIWAGTEHRRRCYHGDGRRLSVEKRGERRKRERREEKDEREEGEGLTGGSHCHMASTSAKPPTKTTGWLKMNGFKS